MLKSHNSASATTTPLSRRNFLAATSTLSSLGGVAHSHAAALPQSNTLRTRLITAVERYRRAASSFSAAFPCSDEECDAAHLELRSTKEALIHAVHAICGQPKPSLFGFLVEEAAPQAVNVKGTLVVLTEPADSDEGPAVYLIPLDEIADLA